MRIAAILTAIVGLLLLAQTGILYQTGHQWFESCWTQINEKRAPATPEEAIAWKQCEPVAEKAIYEAGFIFGGSPEKAQTAASKAVLDACPSNWTDVPIGGIRYLAIRLVEEQGGTRLVDRFIPPEWLVAHVVQTKWPRCADTRAANGYPRIVKRGDTWDFETPCIPCEAERAK